MTNDTETTTLLGVLRPTDTVTRVHDVMGDNALVYAGPEGKQCGPFNFEDLCDMVPIRGHVTVWAVTS